MTATIKEFCRINGIDEASANLADIIYEALIGGEYGSTDRHSTAREKGEAAISNGIAVLKRSTGVYAASKTK